MAGCWYPQPLLVVALLLPTLLQAQLARYTLNDTEKKDFATTVIDATKLLHKKFANTSRFVVSSKVWMNTIPTRDCDILMTFPAKTDDQTLMWLLARLRARTPELSVHVRHHSNTGVYGFYLTATYENLLKGAEDVCIFKPLKKEYGGGSKEFAFGEADCFEGVDDSSAFLTSQERQSIVQHMLFNLRATEGDHIAKITFLEGQALVPFLISRGIVKQVLPLHSSEDLDYLRTNWVQAFFKPQPLPQICNYFGVKIAMYFAYLGHYTKALVLPAFLGFFFWMSLGRNQTWDDWVFVVYALTNVIWSTLYLEHWKREGAQHAYQWGTLDKEDELLTEPRPLYTGYLVKSAVTGRQEPHYPSWKRNMFRYFVSLPIILACLCIVFVTMLYIFSFQDWINARIKLGEMPFYFKYLPKIMLALSIGILDDIYKKIAYWLNKMENYRLDETYEINLIVKLVLFQFVNSFLSLFYIAFYLQDMARLKEQLAALLITRQVIGNIKEALVPWCIEKVKLFRIGYKMTSQMSPDTLERHMHEMTGLTKEKLEAQLTEGDLDKKDVTATMDTTPATTTDNANIETARSTERAAKSASKDSDASTDVGSVLDEAKENDMDIQHSGPQLTQAEVEAGMKTYEDTFEDYLEMVIQFGYVTLFSSAFPMAAMSALLNNVIEIRSDAFKLCASFQRPFGQRVESIGIWQDALELLALIAVMVNCALIGMSGLADRLFPDLSTTQRIVFIIVLEHVILALKLGIAYAIPDVPQWVAEERARLDFMRREALKEKKKVKDLWSKAFDGTKKAGLANTGGPKFKFNKNFMKEEERKEIETAEKEREQQETERNAKEEAAATIKKLNIKRCEPEDEENGKKTPQTPLSYVTQNEKVNKLMNFLKVSINKGMGVLERKSPSEAKEDTKLAQYSTSTSLQSVKEESPEISARESECDSTALASTQLLEELNKKPEVVENKAPVIPRRSAWGGIPIHRSFKQIVVAASGINKDEPNQQVENIIKENQRVQNREDNEVEIKVEENKEVDGQVIQTETLGDVSTSSAIHETKEVQDGITEVSPNHQLFPEKIQLERRENNSSPQPQQGPILIQKTPDIIPSCDSMFGSNRKQTDELSDITGCDSLGVVGNTNLAGNDNSGAAAGVTSSGTASNR